MSTRKITTNGVDGKHRNRNNRQQDVETGDYYHHHPMRITSDSQNPKIHNTKDEQPQETTPLLASTFQPFPKNSLRTSHRDNDDFSSNPKKYSRHRASVSFGDLPLPSNPNQETEPTATSVHLNTYNDDNHDNSLIQKPQLRPSPPSGCSSMDSSVCSKSRGWTSLKSHVNKGDFLLLATQSDGIESKSDGNIEEDDDEDDDNTIETFRKRSKSRESLRQRTFREFETGMNFTVQQCLMAIGVYLGVSILIFSFLLEPQWTIIDSCYFAVSTFTTLGTCITHYTQEQQIRQLQVLFITQY